MKITIDAIDMPAGRGSKCPKCEGAGRRTPPIISEDYEVDEIAGYNENMTKLYIDRRLPEKVANIDIKKSLAIHESVEVILEEWFGFGYAHAHEMAQAAEDRFVELMGGDAKKYEAEWKKLIKKLEHTAEDIPPDILNPNKIKGA